MGAEVVVVASAGAVLVALVAALWRARSRARVRAVRLDRLLRLSDDLATAVGADDPEAVVAAAAERATAGRATAHPGAPATAAFLRSVADQCAQALAASTLALSEQQARARIDSLTEASAELVAREVEHRQRLSEQVKTSSTLEHSLLPAALLPIDDLQVAARYLAAAEGQSVGGDFYDVVRSPTGSAVLVIGDVQGKGIEAATLTSTARHTLRAAARRGAGPAAMLEQLNDALLYGAAERQLASVEPSVRFVTVSVVSLTPNERGFHAVVSNGGHPPPLVIRPDGAVEHLVADGPLLGVFDEPCFVERACQLELSDVLVLYTDGVTEQRRQTDLFDEAQLGRLVRNMLTVRQAEDIAQVILDTVVVLNPREARDDIALLVARVTGPR